VNLRRRIQRLRQRKANVRFRELRALVEAAGWELKSVRGSHHSFVKAGRRPVTIINHAGALSPLSVDRTLDELERDIEEEGGQEG
jgi:predicted RNA binding protein YcfA (HicA-like mRNA interferase family)